MITGLHNSLITVTKESSAILDPVGITPALIPDRQPSQDAVYLEPIISGNSTAGIIKIIGNIGGGDINESIDIDTGGYCPVSTLKYDEIDSLEITGISDGSIWINQVRAQGEPILQEIIIKTLWGSIAAKSGYLRAIETGQTEQSKYIMATMDDEALRVLPNRYIYVKQGTQNAKKFRLNFLTSPGRLGNVLGDLFLIESNVTIPT